MLSHPVSPLLAGYSWMRQNCRMKTNGISFLENELKNLRKEYKELQELTTLERLMYKRLVFYGLASVFVFLLWAPPTVLQWPLYALKALWKDHYDQQELKKQD
ncbi:hypothetical protein MRX96_047333 [Rhipicephalus microplus]